MNRPRARTIGNNYGRRAAKLAAVGLAATGVVAGGGACAGVLGVVVVGALLVLGTAVGGFIYIMVRLVHKGMEQSVDLQDTLSMIAVVTGSYPAFYEFVLGLLRPNQQDRSSAARSTRAKSGRTRK